MTRNIIKWGVLSGAIMAAFFLTTHLLYTKDFKPETWDIGVALGYTSIIIALTVIFFGIRSYRDKTLGGKISFTKAFIMGLGISAVSSVVMGIYVYLLFTVIAPDLSDKMNDAYREKIKTNGESEQVITKELAEYEIESQKMKYPYQRSLFTFVIIFPVGAVMSIICAFILKRKAAISI